MATFIQMVNRIAGDLRRSNLTQEIKNAINDAVKEASKTRFWFNEFTTTVPTQFNNDVVDIIPITGEIDNVYRLDASGSLHILTPVNDHEMDRLKEHNLQTGIPEAYSITKGQLRLYPQPYNSEILLVKGYGTLSPTTFTTDSQTNAWLNEGELYIRELAKRNVYRDIIRDYGEATARDAIAEDYKQQLIAETAVRNSNNTIKATQF